MFIMIALRTICERLQQFMVLVGGNAWREYWRYSSLLIVAAIVYFAVWEA